MNQGIVVENISKSYGGITALRPFSAVFPQGGACCIMGPSGCGKTTLLRLILGLEAPDSGLVRGVDPTAVSVAFQEDRLIPGLSALSNLLLCCKGRTREDLTAQLAQVGLGPEDIHRPARELSGGMQRRVAIVRAMAAPSRLVLLDEPFKGLDQETWRETAAYVRNAREGRTLLAVTHDRRDVEALGASLVELG